MSFQCINAVLDHSQHCGTELLVLLVLANYADDEGRSHPAVGTLAKRCRMRPRNANYILRALQEGGELQVLKNDGPHGVNRYQINLAKLRGQPLQRSAPLQGSAPLQRSARTPAMECAAPLHPSADKPPMNHQEPPEGARKRAARFDAAVMALPDWLPREAWAAWVADRRERRKPLTSRAAAAQVQTLDRFRQDGHNPVDVIDHSIANGWQGLFPPRGPAQQPQRSATRSTLPTDHVFTGGADD